MFTQRSTTVNTRDAGFTLIELIVVMVIIGILAAVALPVYQNQQRQAADTATKSDLNALAKNVASFYVDRPTDTPRFSYGRNFIRIRDGRRAFVSDTQLSPNVSAPRVANGKTPAYRFTDQYDWCVALVNPQGKLKMLKYVNGSGISAGAC